MYLSIIICGRNDNYGGDFTKRLQLFFDWNIKYLEKHQIQSEIVFVNWNPIQENLPIEELITFPTNRKFCSVRIINVPKEIHQNYINENIRKSLPLLEFIAKNAGIVRAKGEYLLVTNADIIISDKIFETLSRKVLESTYYYRSVRCDFKNTNQYYSEEDLLSNTFKVFFPGGVCDFVAGLNISKLTQSFAYDTFKLKFKKMLSWLSLHVFKSNFLQNIFFKAEWFAHCNASGDFILAHKNNWLKSMAFMEDTYISTHTDSIMTLNMKYSGMKEKIFPYPIFHQEHNRRFDFNEANSDMDLMYKKLQEVGKKIILNKKIVSNNNPNTWGLQQYNLEEIIR